jgi:hypothetical protein
LQNLYGLQGPEASAVVDDLHIIHPYGIVGEIKDIPFGTTIANYVSLAAGIKIYTEQMTAADLIAQIAGEVIRA